MKRFFSVFTIVLTLILLSPYAALADDGSSVINQTEGYDPDTASACANSTSTTTSVSTNGSDTLDGFKLPATTGQTGAEESVNDQGQVPSTGQTVSFAKFAKLGQPYRDYYVNMRWTFASWDWSGHSQMIDEKQFNWMNGDKPKLLLITNPKTGKSIIADIIETGPGPSVGSTWRADHGNSSDTAPPYWQGFQTGTPSGYDGMVAGLPPVALTALGMTRGADIDPSYAKGGVTTPLNYSWAPDQNATPGVVGGAKLTSVATSSTIPSTGSACCDTVTAATGTGTTITLTGTSNLEKVMAFLMDKTNGPGFTLAGAAGALGNMLQESGPNIKPNIQEQPVGGDHVFPKGGWGIAQWTSGRRPPLITAINNAGLSRLYTDDETKTLDLSPADNDALLKVELAYMLSELNGSYTSTKSAGQSASDPSQAAFDWENSYEGCTPTFTEAECGVPDRRLAAKQIYDQFLAQADKTGGVSKPAVTPVTTPAVPAAEAASTCGTASGSGTTTGSGSPVSVPVASCPSDSGGTETGPDPATEVGAFNKVVVSYACPSYHSPDYIHMTAGYAAARIRAGSDGRYNASTIPGADCNEFVTTIIHDSGVDTTYNKAGMATTEFYTYMLSSASGWHTIGNAADTDVSKLLPGDVAIKQGHTFVYVGKIDGFNGIVASASHDERTGMAGGDHPGEAEFKWFRKN